MVIARAALPAAARQAWRAWRRAGVTGALAGWLAFHAVAQALVLWSGALGWRLNQPAALLVLALAAGSGLAAAWGSGRAGRGAGERSAPAANPAAEAMAEAMAEAVAEPAPAAEALPAWPWRALGWLALAWLAWAFLQALVLAVLRPPLDWDGLYYHLPAINGWAVAGRVCWLDSAADLLWANGYPLGVEALGLLLHFAFGTSRLADAGNLAYWPLAALAVAALARRLGAGRPWTMLAAALISGAPVFVAQSVTCYSDPAFAACVMAALALAAALWAAPWPPPAGQVVLAGAALGLLAGVKSAGAPYALVLGLVLAAKLLVAAGRARSEAPGHAPSRLAASAPAAARLPVVPWRASPWLIAAGRVGLLLLAAAVVGGYWYGRNVVHTGNPLFPIQVKLGTLILADGYDPARMLAANMPPWLASVPPFWRLPYAWLQTDAPIGGYAPTGGMGFVWLLGGVPAIAALWVWRRRWLSASARTTLALLTALTLFLLLIQPGNWWARFTVWLHALGLPAVAVVLAGVGREGSRGPTLRAGRALAFLWGAGLFGVAAWESQTALTMAWRAGHRPEAPLVSELFQPAEEVFFAGLIDSTGGRGPDGVLAAARLARSRWSRTGTLLGGVLSLPLGARDVALLPDAVDSALVARLSREGRAWVVWDAVAAGPVPAPLRAAAVAERSYRHLPDTDFRFLRLPPP